MKVSSLYLAGLLFFLCGALAHATLIYVDAEWGLSGNTVGAVSGSSTDWAVDPVVNPNGAPGGDNLWGQRTTGPGASSFQTDAWQATSTETPPVIRTVVSGLLANTMYGGLRVYFIGKEATDFANEWFINASIDGVNFTTYRDGQGNANPVNTANGGLGTTITPGTGDIRYYVSLPNSATDAGGNLSIWVGYGPGGSRTVYDGIAYDNTAIPEPSSFALLLLGVLGVRCFPRRR